MSRPLTNFRIAVPDADLRDLRERLTRTRWPEPETVGDWSQGVPRAYLQELCEYWAERYDWRATEARLNALPQFRTELDGLGIHFVHVRSPHPGALPLVVTHGWPGSVAEYLKVIGPLTDPTAHGGDPADAFHVVCPSLPGYGFSDKAAQPGWGVERRSRRPTPRRSTISPTRSARRSARWSRRASGIPGAPSSTPPGPRRSATARGLAGRPVRVDRGEVLGVDRLGDAPRGGDHARRAARHRDALLASRDRRVVRAAVLGEHPAGQPVDLGVRARHRGRADGLRDLPQGDPAPIPALGRAALHRHPPLERARPRRALPALEQPELYVDEVRAFFRLVR